MKNLQIIVICMLTGFLFTTTFTSCSKTDIVESSELTIQDELVNGEQLVLPVGYEEESDALAYINNATSEQLAKMEENYRVSSYLILNWKYGEVVSTLSDNQHISDVDLTPFLDLQQLEGLTSHQTSATACGCRYFYFNSGPCWTNKTCCIEDKGKLHCWVVWTKPTC